jgi:hypothetical protein
VEAAAIITAVSALIAVIGNIYLQTRHIKPIAQAVRQIDSAVNGKPPGATTLVSQVQDLTDQAFPPPEEFTNGVAMKEMLLYLVAKEKAREGEAA